MPALANALRQFSEGDLVTLLTSRPDLCRPAPADVFDLANRASGAGSVRRALDGLTRPEVAVAEAVAAFPGVTDARLCELLGMDVTRPLARLHTLALVVGSRDVPHEPEYLHPVPGLRQAFEPFPGGLADPSPDPLDSSMIEQALLGLPPQAQDVLDRLAWGPPTGAVQNADRTVTDPPHTPIDHLLQRRLLRAQDASTVVLPREVALHLRDGYLRVPLAPPASPAPGPRPARIIDSAAIGAAHEFVRDLEGVLDEVARRAPAALRTGGLSARDLGTLARALSTSPERIGFLLEVAYANGLLTTAPAIVATEAFDRWLGLPLGERFAQVLRGWYASARWPAAARAPGEHPLAPDAVAPWAPLARKAVLGTLAPGQAISVEQIAPVAEWERPALTRWGALTRLTQDVLDEAEWLGLVALGQASSLMAGLEADLPGDLSARFPELVDHVILQSDLTAVATGPLDRRTAADIALLAHVESRGGGTVSRFTPASLSRAFDAGWTAEGIENWLSAHSVTGVPQPLRYLIADVARLHGTVRVGAARAYVRIDDPARLAVVLEHPAAADLGVRRVGPETLVADADPAEVVDLLRRLGLSPAAESASGQVLSAPPPRRPPATRGHAPGPDPVRLAAALVARRDAHRLAVNTEDTVTVLAQAAREASEVEVDYVAADGSAVTARMIPVELSGGAVRLVGTAASVSLPLSRVTAVRRQG